MSFFAAQHISEALFRFLATLFGRVGFGVHTSTQFGRYDGKSIKNGLFCQISNCALSETGKYRVAILLGEQ